MATGGLKQIDCSLLNVGTLSLETVGLDPWAVVVSGDTLMVTDFKASKVYVYRRHDGKLLSSTDKLEAWPQGVCCLNDNEICVAVRDGIERMYVDDTGVIKRGRTFNLHPALDYCHDVNRFMNNVVVCGVKGNTICWCVVSLHDGLVDTVHNICEGRWSNLTTKGNMIYVSCQAEAPNRGVYGFNILNPRQSPFIYKHEGLSLPLGITTDDNGYLFLCDRLQDSIHYLTDKCELVTIYRKGIPRLPNSIFWYRGILYVTRLTSNVITMYQPQAPPQQEPDLNNKGEQSVIEETRTEIEPIFVDKEGSSTETEMPPYEQVTKDSDKERSRTEEDVPPPDHVPNDSEEDKEVPIIPVEILRMDDTSIQLYRKALQDGVEKVYSIRVMVVGQYGVGKTTLIKRLLGQQVDISERNSTEGIDVHTHCCKISLNTGEWILQPEDSDQLTRLKRLRELLSGLDQKPDVSQEQESNVEDIYQRETTSEVHTANNSGTSVKSGAEQDIQLTFSQPGKLSLFKANDEMHSGQESNNVAVPEREVKTNESDSQKDAVMEIFHLINENADKLGKDIVKYATLSVWDFAGQYAFYSTHQTFLTSRALYLLVIDLNQQITDLIKDDKCFLDTDGTKLCKVYDVIEIWLNSILSCAPSSKASIPNVILVGTHVDKISEKSRKEVIDKYFRKLRYMLREKPAIRHLVDDIAIDNTLHDPMMEELKRRIFELSSQQPHWGEEKPARWIPLEQVVMTLKASGAKVVPVSLIEDINMSGSVRIEDRNELELFLKFHHEMGTILYFSVDGLREKIVLDPQWMIDALKSLVTAESFVKKIPAFTSKLYEFIETGKLTHELIDTIWTKENNLEFHVNKEHILQLMEQLNIIARPKFYIEEGKELKLTEENYFLAPCMLQQKTPDEIICPKPNDQMGSTPVMCYVFMGKFLPCPIFHRLIAACVAHWPIATKKKEETEENLIFCGCCVFQLDQYHKLTLFFREYAIFMRVTRMGIREKTPSSKLCIAVKTFVTTNLLKIIGYLGQSLEFEYFIQCPEYSGVSINSLIPVSRLKENPEVRCDLHDNIIESSRLLNLWFEDQKQVDVAGTAVQPRLKMAQPKMGATRIESKHDLPVRTPRTTAIQRSGQLPAKPEKPKAKIQATAVSDKKETPHRIALNRCLSTLVRELDFKLVSMYIEEKELFDDVTMRDISDQRTTSNQIRELIKRIQQRDQDTYEKFKECLIQARQLFLKDMLEKEEAKLLQK